MSGVIISDAMVRCIFLKKLHLLNLQKLLGVIDSVMITATNVTKSKMGKCNPRSSNGKGRHPLSNKLPFMMLDLLEEPATNGVSTEKKVSLQKGTSSFA